MEKTDRTPRIGAPHQVSDVVLDRKTLPKNPTWTSGILVLLLERKVYSFLVYKDLSNRVLNEGLNQDILTTLQQHHHLTLSNPALKVGQEVNFVKGDSCVKTERFCVYIKKIICF